MKTSIIAARNVNGKTVYFISTGMWTRVKGSATKYTKVDAINNKSEIVRLKDAEYTQVNILCVAPVSSYVK